MKPPSADNPGDDVSRGRADILVFSGRVSTPRGELYKALRHFNENLVSALDGPLVSVSLEGVRERWVVRGLAQDVELLRGTRTLTASLDSKKTGLLNAWEGAFGHFAPKAQGAGDSTSLEAVCYLPGATWAMSYFEAVRRYLVSVCGLVAATRTGPP
jgi:hypothetical protein